MMTGAYTLAAIVRDEKLQFLGKGRKGMVWDEWRGVQERKGP